VSSASAGSMFRYSAHCGGWDRDAYGYSGNERRRELKVKSLECWGGFVLLFLGPSDFITPGRLSSEGSLRVETTLKTKTTPSGSKRGNGETGKRGSGVGEKPGRA
jgi:hypothetical protein